MLGEATGALAIPLIMERMILLFIQFPIQRLSNYVNLVIAEKCIF